MDPFVTPVLLILGALGGLAYKQKLEDQKLSLKQPVFSPEARAALTLESPLEAGGMPSITVARFRPSVASLLMGRLAQSSIEAQPVDSGGKGLLYKVVPAAGNLSAAQACATAQAAGKCVLATLSLALPSSPASPMLLFVEPHDRRLASPQGSFAILMEGLVTPAPAPGVAAPKVEDRPKPMSAALDPGMPPEIGAEVLQALANTEIDTGALRHFAAQLDVFPIAQKHVLDRADLLDLQRRLRASLVKPPVEVLAVEAPVVEETVVAEEAPVVEAPSSDEEAEEAPRVTTVGHDPDPNANGAAHAEAS